MKFSIIVVSLNAGDRLLHTVESILCQTYRNYEIIVQDGVSGDGSIDKLPENDKITVVYETDHGIYDAMNRALKRALGEYVLFLNCGDYLKDQNVLTEVAKTIKEHPGKGIYYGDIYNRKEKTLISSNPQITPFACYRNLPCHQACFYARKLFASRAYNTDYKIRADYEHFLFCYFKEGVRPFYINKVLASYEGGGYSDSEEGKALSIVEHKEITQLYMTKKQIITYRIILFLTLAPLRRKITENPLLAAWYQRGKRLLYSKPRKLK